MRPIVRSPRWSDDFGLFGLTIAAVTGGLAYVLELVGGGLGFLVPILVMTSFIDDTLRRYRMRRWEAAYSRTLYVRSRWNPETRSIDEDAGDDKVLHWAVEADRAEGEPRPGQLPHFWSWFIRTSDERS